MASRGHRRRAVHDPDDDDYAWLTHRRTRDDQDFGMSYDNLGRVHSFDAPSGTVDVTTTYDLFGRVLSDTGSDGLSVVNAYDPQSRLVSQTQSIGTVSYQYDRGGRRIRMDYPGSGGVYVTYQYNAASDLTGILQQGSSSSSSSSSSSPVASFQYDDLGPRIFVARGGGWAVSTYGYDAVSRLSSLAINLYSGNREVTYGFAYNPASQIVSRTRRRRG